MFKTLRILILLLILVTVAQEAWLSRSRAVAWNTPLRVAIYPIAGDDGDVSRAYIDTLTPAYFAAIERFFDEEARRHGRAIHHPLALALARPLTERPPRPPSDGNTLAAIGWSLRMRYWAWRHDAIAGMKPQVRLFVQYFDPATHIRLPHSVGIRQGLIGSINAFAGNGMDGSNTVVIAHELLHTLGATDKYDPATNLPRFPEGFADPQRDPPYPQAYAEIMGGRIPLAADRAEIPLSLDETVIGAATAAEIGWPAGS